MRTNLLEMSTIKASTTQDDAPVSAPNGSPKDKPNNTKPIQLEIGVRSVTSDENTGSVNLRITKTWENTRKVSSAAYFNLLFNRIDLVAYKLKDIDQKLSQVNGRLDDMSEKIQSLDRRMVDLDDRMVELQAEGEELSNRINNRTKRSRSESNDDSSDSEYDEVQQPPLKIMKGVSLKCDHCSVTRIYEKDVLYFNPVTNDSCFTCVDCDGINGIYDECIKYVWNC